MKRKRPQIRDLALSKTGQFLKLSKPLTSSFVRELFKKVLTSGEAKRISQQIREQQGSGSKALTYSFLCFSTTPSVPFLRSSTLSERHYGFVLLIERRGHLVIFHRHAPRLDELLAKRTKPIERKRLIHLWSGNARYQKLSTKKMTLGRQELTGASYEAEDLENALSPSAIDRSILKTIRMHLHDQSAGVTPSTGRIRMGAAKSDFDEISRFIDKTLDAVANYAESAFLGAFAEPVRLEDLPADVEPMGILLDWSELHNELDSPTGATALRELAGNAVEAIPEQLSSVLELRKAGELWTVHDDDGALVGRLTRHKHTFSVRLPQATKYVLVDSSGTDKTLAALQQESGGLSVSFSSPEYFFTRKQLYRRIGFPAEADQVLKVLKPVRALDGATSEKGPRLGRKVRRFPTDSLFRIVEDTLSASDTYCWCTDLGDEWADYVSLGKESLTLYHCKHGTPTSGASDFQVVVAQAVKNLSRIKLYPAELRAKLNAGRLNERWGNTSIPRLARPARRWTSFEAAMINAIAEPALVWHVALVVSALSKARFEADVKLQTPKAYTIQLVWLLSAFVSECRARGALPVVYCRP